MKIKIDAVSRGFLIIAICFAEIAHASGYISTYFDDGIKAFNKHDYAHARIYFEKAKKAGMHNAALYFDLGVTYYKLHEYSKSDAEFRRAAQNRKMAALSYYNLGLVAEKQNDHTAAKSWFLKAYHSDNAKIRAIAAVKLGLHVKKENHPYWAFANAAIGYDDNLIDPASGTGNTRGSLYTDYYLAYGAPFNRKKTGGMAFDIAAYLSRYHSLNAYNYNLLYLGMSQPFVTGAWRNKAGVHLEQSTLGGKSYQRAAVFDVRARNRARQKAWYDLRYKIRFIQSLNTAYNYLHGWQQQIGAGVTIGKNKDTQLRYILELNHRDDLYLAGGVFASYSPTRHTLKASHEVMLKNDMKLQTSVAYRLSSYHSANVFANGSSSKRKDSRIRVSLGLIKPLSRHWNIKAEYQYMDNSSNIAGYSYHRNDYRLNAQGLF